MIHTFKEDFYGEILSVVMVGYIRPEKSFDSLGKLHISNVHTHIFQSYFYPSGLCLFCVVFISVSSLSPIEALIAAINSDIEEAKVKLELPEHLKLKEDNFFTSAPSSSASIAPCSTSTSQTILNGH